MIYRRVWDRRVYLSGTGTTPFKQVPAYIEKSIPLQFVSRPQESFPINVALPQLPLATIRAAVLTVPGFGDAINVKDPPWSADAVSQLGVDETDTTSEPPPVTPKIYTV